MKRRFLSISIIVLLLLSAMPLFAQEQTSAIQGTVTDSSGAVLPGVTVEAVSARGQRYSTQSDSNGSYRFPSLAPGIYTVTATLSGLTPATSNNVEARLGASPRVDLKLGLSAVSETISVTAEAPVVDATESGTATSIRAETFEALPKARGFESIVTMAASARQDDRQGGISIDGATGLENRYIVDGVDTTDPLEGDVGKRVITDIIEEVQVKSAGYEAEFGGAMGGVINVITKTGTNEFSGSARVDYRDRSWNGEERPFLQTNLAGTAPEQFVPIEEDFTVIEPGLSIGGPILRDRLWFFGAYHPSIQQLERPVQFLNPGTFPANNSFDQTTRQENILLNLNGSIGSRLVFKVAGNRTGAEIENSSLPGRSGRGAANPALYSGVNTIGENDTYSGHLDFIPSQMFLLSARGGRYKANAYTEGIPATPRLIFSVGSPSLFGVTGAPGQGFSNIPTNSAQAFDTFTRDNISVDGSVFPTFFGSHQIKGGIQFDYVTNQIFSGNQAPQYEIAWGTAAQTRFGEGSTAGTYGNYAVYVFETTGDVESENTAVFLQDSWTTFNDRLTLNLGVRAEKERIPEYTGGEHVINFDYQDKLAPRLGFAYDVSGTGRSRVFGSYGKFYDVMKLDLARGSFGGDKWIAHIFGIESLDFQNWSCTNVTNQQPVVVPTCNLGAKYLTSIDLRHPSTEFVDPDLEPWTSQEFQLGYQQEVGTSMALGFRYVHKEVLRAIEDLGVRIEGDDGSLIEDYAIGNPGFGRSVIGNAEIPGFPKAVRDYDGYELEFTRRMVRNWALHATYLYSKLEGNLPGLANSDEAPFGIARIDPGVGRWGDAVESLFDASGSQSAVVGPLPGDRPHQFKAQASYQAPFGTTVGVSQYVGSGTPVSTQMLQHGVEFFPYGRGDLGRTPTLKQTDLLLQHRFSFGGRYGLEVFGNILNLFDSDTVLSRFQVANTASLRLINPATGAFYTSAQCAALSATRGTTSCNLTSAEFFQGFNAQQQQGLLAADPRFNQASSYQAPREVRVGVRLTF
jgi:hypothetical protein